MWDAIIGGIRKAFDAVVNWILSGIASLVGSWVYYLTSNFLRIVKVLYDMFAVFAGIDKVKYKGESRYLINVFFTNNSISNIYWAMALIGVVLAITFAIIAVIRKSMDGNDKQKKSLGQILGDLFKSIILICSMTLIMGAGISLTNLLIDRVSVIFDNAASLTDVNDIEFTDEQYATMARIYNTIGNYSLNPSSTSRYNINACYNAIRPDLLYLYKQNVFMFDYDEEEVGVTWQSVLQRIVDVADLKNDVNMDVYHEELSDAISLAMMVIRTDGDFYPIAEYHRDVEYSSSNTAVSLDRIIFLMGTLEAAKNSAYNENPSLQDGCRGPFYTGKKSIYSFSDVKSKFDYGIGGISYLTIIILTLFAAKNLLSCILNSIARIFNMLGLYLIAPPVIAVIPLDDGQKFKEWVTSMLVQALGIFGCIIPLRLLILMTPVILGSDLVLLDKGFLNNGVLNMIAKCVLLIGCLEASDRFGKILTGILANSAGHASIMAGDMSDTVNQGLAWAGKKMFGGKGKGKGGEGGGDKEGGGEGGGKGGSDLPENKNMDKLKTGAKVAAAVATGGATAAGAAKAAPKTSTTTTPGNNSTTPKPANSTTTKPANNTTTKPANNNNTTVPKSANGTTGTNGTNGTTVPKSANGTTGTNGTNGTTVPKNANATGGGGGGGQKAPGVPGQEMEMEDFGATHNAWAQQNNEENGEGGGDNNDLPANNSVVDNVGGGEGGGGNVGGEDSGGGDAGGEQYTMEHFIPSEANNFGFDKNEYGTVTEDEAKAANYGFDRKENGTVTAEEAGSLRFAQYQTEQIHAKREANAPKPAARPAKEPPLSQQQWNNNHK